MRYIVSRDTLKCNIGIAQSLIGSRNLSLMFKEYYEQIYPELDLNPTGEIFSVNIPGSICYALGKASQVNKGSIVNNVIDALSLYNKGLRSFYIPIDTFDLREGLTVYEATLIAEYIKRHLGEEVEVKGMITNGCINDGSIKHMHEWLPLWNSFDGNLDGLSVGGSFWLHPDRVKELPEFVSDVRIGRFMLFGYIPYSECIRKNIGKNAMTLEGVVLGVNFRSHSVILDIGNAYCDPEQCSPLHAPDLELRSVSSNYAIYDTASVDSYHKGQRVLFTPEYKHSSALARMKVHYDYE